MILRRRTIASLQRSVEELAKRRGVVDVTSATELVGVAKQRKVGVVFMRSLVVLLQARLQAQLQALHSTIKNKDSEIASLRQAVLTKDMILRVSATWPATSISSNNDPHYTGITART